MPHELQLAGDDVADDVTLTLGAHPDGELEFESGVAIVDDETLAQRLAERYVRLEYHGERETAADDETSADWPFDPAEKTVDELEEALDGSLQEEDELDALYEAEANGKNRDTALDVIETALEE